MPRERRQERSDDELQDTWVRLKHVRLGLLAAEPPGLHVRAENEWQRLDHDQHMLLEAKIAALRTWMERHADPERVSMEFRRMEQTARRYGTPPPVRRLRLTLPLERDAT